MARVELAHLGERLLADRPGAVGLAVDRAVVVDDDLVVGGLRLARRVRESGDAPGIRDSGDARGIRDSGDAAEVRDTGKAPEDRTEDRPAGEGQARDRSAPTLQADGVGALLLVTTCAVNAVMAIYAAAYYADRHPDTAAEGGRFWPRFLLLAAAMNGVFLLAHVFALYVTLEVVGVGAVALVVLGGGRDGLVAGIRYLVVAFGGSIVYLVGVVAVYADFGVLDLYRMPELVRADAAGRGGLALMTVGLLVTAALFPLHFWLPSAHSLAPAAGGAVLAVLARRVAWPSLPAGDAVVALERARRLARGWRAQTRAWSRVRAGVRRGRRVAYLLVAPGQGLATVERALARLPVAGGLVVGLLAALGLVLLLGVG